MMLVQPGATRVRIWIPEADNLFFPDPGPVRVALNVMPSRTLEALLRQPVSPRVSLSPQSVPCFVAQAEWAGAAPELKLGLQGTAILQGENVSLLYWLLRKPWAGARRVLGL